MRPGGWCRKSLNLDSLAPPPTPSSAPRQPKGPRYPWEARGDLAAPPALRGGALGWKPRMGTGWGVRLGGGRGFPAEAFAPARRPHARSQAPAAQSPWPNSRAGGELPGETHRPEKLLENSGWPPGAVTRRLSRPRAPWAPGSGAWPPFPPTPPTWDKLEGVPENPRGRRGSAPRASPSPVVFRGTLPVPSPVRAPRPAPRSHRVQLTPPWT